MASELRVNQITSTTGVGTVTFDSGGVTFVGTPNLGNAAITSINSGAISGTRNRITNGSMRIDQRYVGQLVNPITSSGYSIDQWIIAMAGAGYNVRTQGNLNSATPPVGFTSYFGVQNNNVSTPTGTNNLQVQHRVEGYNMSDFNWGTANAKTVTLSFWVQSSLVGTYGGSLRNSANDRSYVYEYRINNANTWEYKTITIPGDTTGTWLTTNNVGIRVIWGLSAGSSSQGNPNQWSADSLTNSINGINWAGTANAIFYLTGVQLEVGSRATEFERISYGDELRLCQRYYQQGKAWGYVRNDSATNATQGGGSCVNFAVQMRSAPTVSTFSGSSFTALDVDSNGFGFQTTGGQNANSTTNATYGATAEL